MTDNAKDNAQQPHSIYQPTRVTVNEAIELVSAATTNLEHQHPEQWPLHRTNKLRGVLVLLKRLAEGDDLLTYLSDWVSDRDVLFRASRSPDTWEHEEGDMDVIDVRHWYLDDVYDTAESALRREYQEDIARVR